MFGLVGLDWWVLFILVVDFVLWGLFDCLMWFDWSGFVNSSCLI